MNEPERTRAVLATPRASTLLKKLKEQHGDLLLHLSGGCCDGSVPLCLRQSEFRIGARDVLLDIVDGVPFYVNEFMFPYLRDGQITLDAVPGINDSFSLEAAEDMRFVTSTAALDGALPRTCKNEI